MTTLLPAGFTASPFAHRALHGPTLPENSAAVVRAAVTAGYGIEIDLQLSSDGRAIVFHDYTLDRLTNETGTVRESAAADLGRMPLLNTTETIPTLARVLDLIGGKVPLVIEIKDQDGALGPDVGALEAATAHDLKGYDGPVAVMSSNPHSVMAMQRLAPGVSRGLVTEAFIEDAWPRVPASRLAELATLSEFGPTGAAFISHEVHDLANPRVAALRSAGVPVLCWTVRSPETAAYALNYADTITFEGFLPPVGRFAEALDHSASGPK